MTRIGRLIIVLIAAFIVEISARNGVDLSVPTDSTTWNCLVSQQNVTFAMIRAYRSSGVVDINSANTIQLAKNAGIKDVDGYMFPCISTSPYSLSHQITCDSAEKQVADTLGFLSSKGVSPSSLSNVQNTKATFGRMWLDIEDESPSKYYDSGSLLRTSFFAIAT